MLSGWQYRNKLTIDSTKIDALLTNFQIIVALDNSNFDFSKAKSDGTDIRFTSNDGDTLLSFERIIHDSVNEIAFYQVKVLSISSTSDTDLYIYYGNTSASDGENKSDTWPNEFIGVWHLDESGSAIFGEFKDSTDNAHHGQGGGGDGARVPSQVNAVVYKGQDFDESERDMIAIPTHADFTLGTEDFLFSTNIVIESFPENYPQFISKDGDVYHGFQFAYNNASNLLYFGYSTDETYDTWTVLSVAWTPSIATQYNIAVRRDSTSLYFYVNGVQQGSAQTIGTDSITGAQNNRLMFGSYDSVAFENGDFNGIQDEIVFIKGESKSSAWIKANYNSLYDTLLTYGSEELISFSLAEGVVVSDSVTFKGKTTININESIILNDSLNIEDSVFKLNEEIILNDSCNLELTSKTLFHIDFRTLVQNIYKYSIQFLTSLISIKKYALKIYTKAISNNKFHIDLRVRYDDYDSLTPGTLDDFVVYLDGVELTDVDYTTLQITYSLNSVPSTASFTLARHHDNLDYKLNGDYSQITNENKVQIYDGIDLLLTCYITQISAISNTDTVQVTAEDARYKIKRTSLDIWYGGKYEKDEDEPEVSIKSEKNIGLALQEVLTAIGSIISGYDVVPFQTSFTPEYVETYTDCASLLDTLICQTSNANWYLDENERLKYQRIEHGTIKTLPLSSLTSHRHLYDVILSDVNLNKQNAGYAKSYSVKFGKHTKQRVLHYDFNGNDTWDFSGVSGEKTAFGFQQWGSGKKWYCGMNPTLYGYVTSSGWVLKPSWIVQIIKNIEEIDIPNVIIGSGLPVKTLDLTSYGITTVNKRYEELSPSKEYQSSHPSIIAEQPYFSVIESDNYNHYNYALDIANFELSQNNKLKTDATVSLILDAYKYYSLNFADRINLSNTINPSIYKDNNGFPLNITQIMLDCSTRVVTLSLSNEGKSWGLKTASYLSNYTPANTRYILKKQSIMKFSQGV